MNVRTYPRDRWLLSPCVTLATGAVFYLTSTDCVEEQKLTAARSQLSSTVTHHIQLDQLLTWLPLERSPAQKQTATAPRHLTIYRRNFSANKSCAIPVKISERPWNSLRCKTSFTSSMRFHPVEMVLQTDVAHNAGVMEANRTCRTRNEQ